MASHVKTSPKVSRVMKLATMVMDITAITARIDVKPLVAAIIISAQAKTVTMATTTMLMLVGIIVLMLAAVMDSDESISTPGKRVLKPVTMATKTTATAASVIAKLPAVVTVMFNAVRRIAMTVIKSKPMAA